MLDATCVAILQALAVKGGVEAAGDRLGIRLAGWCAAHPKTVQALLGHAKTGIALDTHSYLMEGWDDGLGDAINEALGELFAALVYEGPEEYSSGPFLFPLFAGNS